MEVKAEVKSISKLNDYFFVVPDYQREYVWKVDYQVEQFLVDIDNEYEAFSANQKSYFIGSIIIVENHGKFDVIDGQQRLTTIMLSLCAFRDILEKQQLDTKQQKYLKNLEELLTDFDIESEQDQLRLELQYEESSGYLEKIINRKPFLESKTPSVQRMEDAYFKLQKHFSQILEESQQEFLDFMKYFLTKVELVIIKSENLSSALKIFETINQRGAGLNAMDLVKNLLFAKARESEFKTVKEIWKQIVLNLQSCREDSYPLRFLRYFVISRYHNGVIREDDLYRWFVSKEGISALNYEDNPVRLAKELRLMSQRYSDLVNATELGRSGGKYPNVTNIGYINKQKSRQHLVLLLALDESISDEGIEYVAKQIESFYFYSNTLGIQAKYNENLFSKWSIKLRGKKNIPDLAEALCSQFVPYLQDKLPEFKNRFKTILHFNYSPQYRERYVLGKLENTIRAKCNLPLHGNDFINGLQIEHILPQSPKDGIIPDGFEDIHDYRNFVYRIGNTTLLEGMINQAINNCNDFRTDWFDRKKKQYQTSDLISTKLLDTSFSIGSDTALNRFKTNYDFEFREWSKNSIEKRQSTLLRLAFETWKINDKNIDIN